MVLNESEIARRAPVWEALADLFLDTELEDFQYRHIADTLRDSGYSQQELQKIFCDEVAPAFHRNLSAVPGEWQGWSTDAVKELVLEYLNRRPTFAERLLPKRWLQDLRLANVRERWEAVRNLLLVR